MTTTPNASSKRKTWISVVIAAGIIVGTAAIAIVTGGVIFFYHHINSTDVAPTEARSEFERTRARFAGQLPLFEVTTGRVIRRPTPDAPRHPITAFHMITYHPDEGDLTRLDMPGWALRFVPSLSGSGLFEKLDVTHGSGLDLTLEDLERSGPGLILDIRRPEVQALMWIE